MNTGVGGGASSAPTFAIQSETPREPAIDDVWTYRVITIGLAAAFVLFTAGIVVIVALGKKIDPQLWALGTTVGGTLIGILIPAPSTPKPAPSAPKPVAQGWKRLLGTLKPVRSAAAALKRQAVPVSLMVAFVTSVLVGGITDNKEIIALATSTGGALLGYFAPSPRSGAPG